MSNQEVIDEFLESMQHWANQLKVLSEVEPKYKMCMMCGIRPEKMLALVEAVKELKEKAWMYDDLSK